MIIKKFTGNDQTEAILKAKQELGPDAIVTNVKKIKPRGIMALFKKTTYEITAALDDTPPKTELSRKESMRALFRNSPDIIFDEEPEKEKEKDNEKQAGNFNTGLADTAAIELKLNNLTSMIEQKMNEKKNAAAADGAKLEDTETDKNVGCIRLVYNQLVENEVDEKYINQLISEIEPTLKKDTPIETIISAVYQKIVLKLGKTEGLDLKQGHPKYIFFIGPTGVGKTTTIAKLASKLKLENGVKVALMTSDTYRIAAVEQLQTYANILNVPLKIVYNEEELKDAQEDLAAYDLVLVDTAGRSHRDRKQRDDIERIINAVPEEDREVYLVLSVTTKYKDLIAITEAYSEISGYRLIFTKLDETAYLGNIYNIKLLTGASLSYATFGQRVPNDISRVNAQTIAKQLLGGAD